MCKNRNNETCLRTKSKLVDCGFRAEIDTRNEKVGFKIREHTIQRIPFLIIIGDKEKEDNQITLRHKKDNLGSFFLESFIQSYQQEFYSPIDNDT